MGLPITLMPLRMGAGDDLVEAGDHLFDGDLRLVERQATGRPRRPARGRPKRLPMSFTPSNTITYLTLGRLSTSSSNG